MSGLKGMASPEERSLESADSIIGISRFATRVLIHKRWWILPRRVIVALMCYLALFIKGWMMMDFAIIFFYFFALDANEIAMYFPKGVNWTSQDVVVMDSCYSWAHGFAQIPVAALAILFSGHSLLGWSVALSSILHIITPTTMRYHAIGVIILISLQGFTMGPMFVACLSLWREWAPAAERSRLVVLAFSGVFFSAFVSIQFTLFFVEHAGFDEAYIASGTAGLVWCILWYTLTADSPSNDPRISSSELLYLEDNIPPEIKHKVELKCVPLLSIVKSPAVLSLCFAFFSAACSVRIMLITSWWFHSEWLHPLLYVILFFLPVVGVLADIFLRKTNGRVTLTRKVFCCSAFILYNIPLLGLISDNNTVEQVCLMVSFIILLFSIAGYMPNALDLSPPYSPVIMSLATFFSAAGSITFDYLLEFIINEIKHPHNWKFSVIIATALSVCSALLFAVFGSGEEQPWSCRRTSTTRRIGDDSRYYPTAERVDDDCLVTASI